MESHNLFKVFWRHGKSASAGLYVEPKLDVENFSLQIFSTFMRYYSI